MSRMVLIAGASRGIGLALARSLVLAGDRVQLCARPSPRIAALEREFRGSIRALELCDEAAVNSWVAGAGAVDAYVHCAGDFHAGPGAQLEPAQLRRLFESNLLSAQVGFSAVREALRSSRGSALFFGTAGLEQHRARRSTAAYSAMKSALLMLVRSWALEEASHGVRINLLSPGLVPHPDAEPSTLDPARQAALPLGRAARLEEIVAAAQWLISGRAGYMTGVNLEVAGGWLDLESRPGGSAADHPDTESPPPLC